MEKTAFLSKSKSGMKRKVNLLFRFPYDDTKGLEEICPDFKQHTLIKNIKKMELICSYDSVKFNSNLLNDYKKALYSYLKKTSSLENYSIHENDDITPANKAFNEWINNPKVLIRFADRYDKLFGFPDSMVKNPEYQLYIAFKAGFSAGEKFSNH